MADQAETIFIDEPELALDAINLAQFISDLKALAVTCQVVIISHHPFLVLEPSFNVMEFDGKRIYQNVLRNQLLSLLNSAGL